MNKDKVTIEELEKSLEYLDNFEKGVVSGEQVGEGNAPGFDKSEQTNGDFEALKRKHEQGLAESIKKAKEHKEALDKLNSNDEEKEEEELPEKVEKGAGEGESESDEDNVKKRLEKIEKGLNQILKKGFESEPLEQEQDPMVKQLGELFKSKMTEAISEINDSNNRIVKGLQDRLEELENQPLPKSITKGAEFLALEKAAFRGEKVDGKVLLSKAKQPFEVSNAIYKAFQEEKDEFAKASLAEAVTLFESSKEIRPETVMKLERDYDIKLI